MRISLGTFRRLSFRIKRKSFFERLTDRISPFKIDPVIVTINLQNFFFSQLFHKIFKLPMRNTHVKPNNRGKKTEENYEHHGSLLFEGDELPDVSASDTGIVEASAVTHRFVFFACEIFRRPTPFLWF